MLKDSSRQIIRSTLKTLKQPVRLILFTSDLKQDECAPVRELAMAVKAASPRIVLEKYDQVMDRDKAAEYGVQRVPSLVVQGRGIRAVSFSGMVDGVSLMLLLDAVRAIAEERAWFPESIASTLGMLERQVAVRVILDNDCTLCRPVAETAVGLALTNRLVATEIVVADDFPDLLAKHRVRILPYTLFGTKLHLEGHVTESAFLEMIFQAAGRGAEPDRRCMVCGSASPEIICSGCKSKIQAEAVDHKRRDERLHERGMTAEAKRRQH